MKTEIINLKGGAKLLFNRQTDVNGIDIRFNFKAGALNDPIGKLGVAHFCEHALCSFSNAKMTRDERHKKEKEFVYSNAYTDLKNMCFVGKCVEEDFEDLVDFKTESFRTIKFSQEEFEKEKKIILDESKTRVQTNGRLVNFIAMSKFYNQKQFSNAANYLTGNEETINKITLGDLENFIAKYISTNNLVVSVSGNIKKSKAVSIIKKYVEKNLSESKFNGFDEHEIKTNKPTIIYQPNVENGKAYLSLTYDLKNVPFTYVLNKDAYIYKILTKSIFLKVKSYFRDKYNLCYSCGSNIRNVFGHLRHDIDIPCNIENMKEIVDRFGEFISTLEADLSKEEFEKNKKMLKDTINFDFSRLDAISEDNIGIFNKKHLVLGDKLTKVKLKLIDSVTYEDVNECYKTLFTVKPFVVMVADERFKDFSYDDIVTTKKELELSNKKSSNKINKNMPEGEMLLKQETKEKKVETKKKVEDIEMEV